MNDCKEPMMNLLGTHQETKNNPSKNPSRTYMVIHEKVRRRTFSVAP